MVHRAFCYILFGIVFAPRDWEILFLLRKIFVARASSIIFHWLKSAHYHDKRFETFLAT